MATIANINPITDNQRGYLTSLRTQMLDLCIRIAEAQGDQESAAKLEADRAQTLDVDGLSKRDASGQIDSLKNSVIPALRETLRNLQPSRASNQVEEGFYLVDGRVIKVQVAVHGSGRLYGKVLDPGTGRFVYQAGIVRECTADRRMTLEQAAEYGHLYGVCARCGRPLTDEDSIARGIGPVCAGKF
jgi:hypothetical protein